MSHTESLHAERCAALHAEIVELYGARRHLIAENERLRAERAVLQDWKDSMLAVEASWSDQEVARLLGLPLGGAIRPAIKPAIQELQEEVGRLRKDVVRLNRECMMKPRACDQDEINRLRAEIEELRARGGRLD